MKISIFLLASLLSPSLSAPLESDRLPQFLQSLPFFSELQSLQQTFQDLQASLPPEVLAQIQQSLPPFLANLLAAGQQQPAGRGLENVAQQIQQSLPPFLANLLASQLTNDGNSALLQQLQTVLPPEIFQQLQQIIANLQPSTARAEEIAAETELTEDQKKQIEEFVKRCQSFGSYGGYNSGYRYPTSGYNSYYPYTGYPYTGYNTGYNTGYPTISIQQPAYGTLYGTNGGVVATGRKGEAQDDDIETMRKWGGKWGGGKFGWNKQPFNNYQKPSYGNYQKPSYGNYQQPSFQNPYYNPYNGYQNPYQIPNYSIGILGDNGVVVPATGTGTGTGTNTGTNTGTVTAIRDQPE